MNATASATRLDTVMGRALSKRAVALTAAMTSKPYAGDAGVAPTSMIDLTTPETPATPGPVQEAAGAALDRGETHYTTRPGVTALREAIARRMTGEGFPASADAMLITNGGSEALYIALQTLLEKGQRVIVAGPTQPNIIEMIRFIGAEPVRPTAAGSFFPGAGAIDAADASAILLASPSPVTGLALLASELEAIIEAAVRRDMTVFLDRSLATALYDPVLARFGNLINYNRIGFDVSGNQGALSVEDMLGPVAEGLAKVREAGLTRMIGITGLGETAAVRHSVSRVPSRAASGRPVSPSMRR